jgi:hypothetical protein
MERRLRRLEAARQAAHGARLLRHYAGLVAAEYGLDPAEVVAEAERLLREVRAGRSLGELVSDPEIDLATVEAQARELWDQVGELP